MKIINELFSLKEKHIVVTGATGLIGKSITIALTEFGAALTLVGGRNIAKLHNIHNELLDIGATIHAQYSLDISSKESIKEFLHQIDKSQVKVDGLVHCAMHRPGQRNIDRYEHSFEESLLSNAVSSFLIWDKFAKLMAAQGGGSLVYIGSIYGKVSPDFSIYEDTEMGTEPDYPFIKEGMNGLSKYYANKFGKEQVRSNVVILGGVSNHQPVLFVDRFSRKTSMHRMAVPKDIAGACVYLLSDASQYVTGSEIRVDGGFLSK